MSFYTQSIKLLPMIFFIALAKPLSPLMLCRLTWKRLHGTGYIENRSRKPLRAVMIDSGTFKA